MRAHLKRGETPVNGDFREKFTLEYEGAKDAEKLGMFRQRLHDRRAA